MIRRIIGVMLALLFGTAVYAAPAQAAYAIENSPSSRSLIVVDNYCSAAKLGSTVATLSPGRYTTTNNKGFQVPKGRMFSVWKNGYKYISNVTSQGNAVCTPNWTAFVLVQT